MKDYVSENDKHLIYEINENYQYLFKTSRQKLRRDGNSFMNAEYCYFDRNFKKVKSYVTLTASVYHSMLRKQVVLASRQCKQEDKEKIEIFWRIFNKAYKEMHRDD